MLWLIFFSFSQDFFQNSKIGQIYLSIFETLEYFWTFYLQNYIINGQSNLKQQCLFFSKCPVHFPVFLLFPFLFLFLYIPFLTYYTSLRPHAMSRAAGARSYLAQLPFGAMLNNYVTIYAVIYVFQKSPLFLDTAGDLNPI